MNIDEIAPDYLAQDYLKLSLVANDPSPRTGEIIRIQVDYSRTLPAGIVMPLLLTVTQPDGTKLRRYVYKRFAPAVIDFVPEVSGTHMVRLGEVFHNRWFGFLEVDVAGDVDLNAPLT